MFCHFIPNFDIKGDFICGSIILHKKFRSTIEAGTKEAGALANFNVIEMFPKISKRKNLSDLLIPFSLNSTLRMANFV